jgi:SAM-dependent methyltransferase
MADFAGERLLDVGCGDGSFTEMFAPGFSEVHGIDLQGEWLAQFAARTRHDPKFHVIEMSASNMSFPAEFFDMLISLETLEHIENLEEAVSEFARVLRPGGVCLVTCPNRLFPFENHGMRLGKREFHCRIPLLTYMPFLHPWLSLARAFTVRGLDRLFLPRGFQRQGLDYIFPTFEHGGNPLQFLFKPLFPLMRALENSPLRALGTSIVMKFTKLP